MPNLSRLSLLILLLSLATSAIAQVGYDFEDGSLDAFLQSPSGSWMLADSTSLINPTTLNRTGKTLQHNGTVASGSNAVSRISILPKPSNSATCDTFSWLVRHAYTGAPSTNNYWLAMLAANVDAEHVGIGDAYANVNAYAVGSYPTVSGENSLKLLKIEGGKLTKMVELSSAINPRALGISIRLTRSASGEWTLWAHATNADAIFGTTESRTARDTADLTGEYFGFVYAFSPTAAKQLYVDNIEINLAERPLNVLSARRETSNSLHVELNRTLATAAADASLYRITTGIGTTLNIDSVKLTTPTTLQLFVADELTTDTYTLALQNVPDLYGTRHSSSFSFALHVLLYGDIVFSELMVKPNSEGALPDEYIELYNRTAFDIDLAGWTIASSTRTGRITAGLVRAGSYALIGSNMAAYGTLLAVSNRPTLTDAGGTLTLADSYGTPVAMVPYSDAWYGDEEKKAGGFSLEKVDLNNLEESANNWRASTDERGGTPGIPNFVAAANPDNTPPACIGYAIMGSTITLYFSEAIAKPSTGVASFLLDNEAAQKVALASVQPMQLRLVFARELSQHTTYTLSVGEGAVCDLSSNCMADFVMPIGFGELPTAGDVVINELLFNPNVGGVDFVELYNRSDKIVELEGLRIANRSATSGAIDRSYPLPRYTLFPDRYVVLTTNPDAVREQYVCPNPQAFIALATMPAYPNETGCVALQDTAGDILEEFYYSDKMHSGVLTNHKGVSLERINPRKPSNDGGSWLSAAQAVGFATPTGRNSQYSEREGDGSDNITVFPETFSPDGDGYDDVLFIAYAMPAEGYIANIAIYDAAGRLARTLCRNTTLATEGQLSWDGTCDNGKPAAIGIYVVYAEVFTLDGKAQRYKKNCVVGRRF